MSDPRKLPPDEAWDAVTRMAMRDEAERVEALSPEELAREVAATGRDPEVERAKALALVARIKGEASAPANAAAGAGAARAPGSTDAGGVSRAAPRPGSRTLVWALAAVLGGGAVVLFFERQEIIALFHPEKRQPIEIRPDPDARPSVAAALRDEASKECDAEKWGLCATELDDARAIDPAGESSAVVKAMRKAIESHSAPDATYDDKRPIKGSGR
jgi:hypothetical protein